MEKTLTTVGNSKALIIPAELIKKYKLDRVTIEETDQGILIKPARETGNFQEKLAKLREYKSEIYEKMENEAREPEIEKYYADLKNNFSEIDPEIL
jgi:antitoxin component of MazEF toxin-antitoxin module